MTREEVDERFKKLSWGSCYREQSIRKAAEREASRDWRDSTLIGDGRTIIPWSGPRRPVGDGDYPRESRYYTIAFWHPGGNSFATQFVIEEQIREQLDEFGI